MIWKCHNLPRCSKCGANIRFNTLCHPCRCFPKVRMRFQVFQDTSTEYVSKVSVQAFGCKCSRRRLSFRSKARYSSVHASQYLFVHLTPHPLLSDFGGPNSNLPIVLRGEWYRMYPSLNIAHCACQCLSGFPIRTSSQVCEWHSDNCHTSACLLPNKSVAIWLKSSQWVSFASINSHYKLFGLGHRVGWDWAENTSLKDISTPRWQDENPHVWTRTWMVSVLLVLYFASQWQQSFYVSLWTFPFCSNRHIAILALSIAYLQSLDGAFQHHTHIVGVLWMRKVKYTPNILCPIDQDLSVTRLL